MEIQKGEGEGRCQVLGSQPPTLAQRDIPWPRAAGGTCLVTGEEPGKV